MSLLTALQLEALFIVALLLPLLLQLVALYLTSRALWTFTGRYFGRTVWALFALVGVPLHELSHAIAFMLTGAGVRRMVLFAPRGLPEYNGATGVVVPRRKPSGLSRLVSSIAPFFGCSLAAWLALRLLLPGFEVEAPRLIVCRRFRRAACTEPDRAPQQCRQFGRPPEHASPVDPEESEREFIAENAGLALAIAGADLARCEAWRELEGLATKGGDLGGRGWRLLYATAEAIGVNPPALLRYFGHRGWFHIKEDRGRRRLIAAPSFRGAAECM